MTVKEIKNGVGRMIPTEINGKSVNPFMGLGKHRPQGKIIGSSIPTCLDYPLDGDKTVPSLKEALIKAGLKDGMTISTHHHLRNGDLVANEIFKIASQLGVKDLTWYPSASFPSHEPLIEFLKNGTIHHIEGSMNGPLGRFTSQGKMKGVGILRSHGGRVQALKNGEVKIDIAVMAAPASDKFGNANGQRGPSACGVLGYAKADSMFAEKVIIVTDHLENFPCMPMEVEGNYVDYVVEVDHIGIPEKIVSGTTKVTTVPERLEIAELSAQFLLESGILKDRGFIQAGAGGISLAIGQFIHQIFKKKGWKIQVGFGGSTEYMVSMLKDGTMEHLLDGQAFDLTAVHSITQNANHNSYPVFNAYNFHSKGNLNSMMDLSILGATEVDVNFNANVVTHSDGYLLHGIGGWQNCLHAKNVILPLPLVRRNIPVVRDEVTTIVGPGELIDVIITNHGIAINPERKDLLEKMKNSTLPIVTIEELKDKAEQICGKQEKPDFTDKVVAAVKWVDGTVIDVIRQIK
ncbi:MAG: citrate lyase subunit alpha [Candidatus Cloacimonetes bacterium]|nr:citrate lyase subunit alpha [Candidatus Cloacimonadota bacterium]MCF7813337.1 citrate lyase subunit alpha [Candidatus Cloacimonadota bacterium]MCF7867826.1 citrate lyase subunit alpha [Candidatus Cloacimonadota bacterium]MCF7883288.1 citrate lyase subunit alpha [Candidatus Cloacimonadota bacterium]